MSESNKNSDLKKTSNNHVSVLSNLKKYASEYCNITSIHGCKYLGENRSPFEIFWWIVVLTTSITCCFVLIYKTYIKWESSPIIVSFQTTETPIYEIPFPAITICPEVKIRAKMFNYTTVFQKIRDKVNLTSAEQEGYEHFSMICDSYYYWGINSTRIPDNDKFLDYVVDKTPDFLNDYMICEWFSGDYENCTSFFTPILTDEGLCYTFNMFGRAEMFTEPVVHHSNFHLEKTDMFGPNTWDPNTLQYGSPTLETYPVRALVPGAKSALSIILITPKEDVEYLCKDSVHGFRVLLHNPVNVPRLSFDYFRVPLDQAVLAAVKPVMMTTSKSLIRYDPKVRRCYFTNERKLRFFRIYTQHNCQMECLTNFTQGLCNCSGFYMPKMGDSRICGVRDLDCMQKAEILQEYQMANGLYDKFKLLKPNLSLGCDCLPTCTSVDYNVEVSHADWNWRAEFRAAGFNVSETHPKITNNDDVHISRFDVFLKTNQIIGLERHELYGPTDFIANFGGLLGLFTGFSIISFMEIVYFLTLRFLCNFRRFGLRNNWYPT